MLLIARSIIIFYLNTPIHFIILGCFQLYLSIRHFLRSLYNGHSSQTLYPSSKVVLSGHFLSVYGILFGLSTCFYCLSMYNTKTT